MAMTEADKKYAEENSNGLYCFSCYPKLEECAKLRKEMEQLSKNMDAHRAAVDASAKAGTSPSYLGSVKQAAADDQQMLRAKYLESKKKQCPGRVGGKMRRQMEADPAHGLLPNEAPADPMGDVPFIGAPIRTIEDGFEGLKNIDAYFKEPSW